MMAEELGRIQKPPADNFKQGRKLYFIPIIYCGKNSPKDYQELFEKYWEQVSRQIDDFDSKLGRVNKVFHELISSAGEDGPETIKKMNERSYGIVRSCLDKGACLEAVEENDLLTELMDWSRCLFIGLQNEKVLKTVQAAYQEVSQKRNARIVESIDRILKDNEIGILLMQEIHQLKLPPDIQVFYIAPPALNDIEHWLRARQEKQSSEPES